MKRLLLTILLLTPSLWGVCQFNATVDNTWANGSNWSGCAGTGGIPATTDTPNIGAHTLTLATSQTVVGVIGLGTSTLHILSGGNLSTTGIVASSSTFAAGSQITIDAGGQWIAGGGGAAVGNVTIFTGATLNVSGVFELNQGIYCNTGAAIHLHAGSSLLASGNGVYVLLTSTGACTIDDDATSWGTIPDGTPMSSICPSNAATYNTICISTLGSTVANNLQIGGTGSRNLTVNLQYANVYNVGPSTGTTGIIASGMTWNNVHIFNSGAIYYSPVAVNGNWQMTNISLAGGITGVTLYCNNSVAVGSSIRALDHIYIRMNESITNYFEPTCPGVNITNSVLFTRWQTTTSATNLTVTGNLLPHSTGMETAGVQMQIPCFANWTISNNYFAGVQNATSGWHLLVTQNNAGLGQNLFSNNVIDAAPGGLTTTYAYAYIATNNTAPACGPDIFADNLLLHFNNAVTSNATLGATSVNAKHITMYDMQNAQLAVIENESSGLAAAYAYMKSALISSYQAAGVNNVHIGTWVRQRNGICQVSTSSPITVSGGAVTIPLTGCTQTPAATDNFTFGGNFKIAAFLNGQDCFLPSAASATSITCTLNYPAVTPTTFSANETATVNVYLGFYYQDNNYDTNTQNGSSTGFNLWDYTHNRAGTFYIDEATPMLASTAVSAVTGSPTATSVSIAGAAANVKVGDWAYCTATGGTQLPQALITAISGTGPTTFTLGHNNRGTAGLPAVNCSGKNVQVFTNVWDATTCPNNPDCYGGPGMGQTDTMVPPQYRNMGYDIGFIANSLNTGDAPLDFANKAFKCGGMDVNGVFVSTSIDQRYCVGVGPWLANYRMAWGSMNGMFKNSEPDGRDKGVSGWVYPAAIQQF